MKRYSLFKAFVVILFSLIWSVQFSRFAAAESEISVESEFKQFQKDIPSLYLINGLFLSKEQTAELVSILQQAKLLEDAAGAATKRIEKKYRPDFDRAIEATMNQISNADKVDRRTLKSLKIKKLQNANNEISAVRGDTETKLNALADKVYALLTPSQQYIVNNFKPCFIPQRDFRSPQRIGQATDDTSEGEKVLSRLRKVPEDSMGDARKRALDGMVRYVMYKRHIKYSESAAQKVHKELSERLEKVLPQALALRDVDFELQKSTLSRELLPLEEAREPSQIRWVVRTYLLNTENIQALQSRMKDN